MTNYLAFPPARSVRGRISAPPSKSATNRALVLAALGSEPVEIVSPLDSGDTRALARCLQAMGARLAPTDRGIAVQGPLGRPDDRETVLDAAASGTAARFLTAVAAAVPGRYRVTGEARLLERPMEELVDALASAGASVEFVGRKGFLPLSIRGATLRAGIVDVDASRSSQFLSALALAGVAVEGGLTLRPIGAVASAPYVATTLSALEGFGHVAARSEDGRIRVERGASVRSWEVPGDWSSALPFFAAVGIAGGEVTVTGLSWPSPDADALALEAIEAFGIAVERRPGQIRARSDPGPRRPASFVATDFPDAVPTLAAIAAFAEGESRFHAVAHLRFKESDRIASLARLLAAAGVSASPGREELAVTGPPSLERRPAAPLPTFGDHRIAMAASLLSLAPPGGLIEDPDCTAKSYPGFFRDLETILVRG